MGGRLAARLKEIKKDLEGELKIVEQDIKDFTKPLSETNYDIDERLTGRLSTENLIKNSQKRIELEFEIAEIDQYLNQGKW